MNLHHYFPKNFSTHTQNLFISNFSTNTLASPYHGALNYNWFFQCRGAKRWWMIEPDHVSYLGAWLQGLIILPSNYNEQDIVEHLPQYMVDTEEGDMLFTPAFWMHAVATRPGLSMAVANRKFMHQQALFTNPYHYLLAGVQFPLMVARIITQKARKGIPYTLSALKFMEHETGRSEGVGLFQHLGINDHDWTIS